MNDGYEPARAVGCQRQQIHADNERFPGKFDVGPRECRIHIHMEILGGFDLVVESPHYTVGNVIERESYRRYMFVVIHEFFDILRWIVGTESHTMDVFGVANIHCIQGAVYEGSVHIDL